MKKMPLSKSLLALMFAAALAGPKLADAADIQGIFKAGYDFGGETVESVPFTDGSTESLKANEGLYLGGGVAIVDDDRDWEFDLTLAYKFARLNASNGDVTWSRWPLEALVFYRFRHVRIGGGLTYHFSPKVEGSDAASFVDFQFKNALGGVLQVDWRITENVATGLRYTFLKYELESGTGAFTGPADIRVKSDGVGLTFSWNF